MKYEGDGDRNSYWCAWNNPQRLGTGSGRLRNKKTSGDQQQHYKDRLEY